VVLCYCSAIAGVGSNNKDGLGGERYRYKRCSGNETICDCECATEYCKEDARRGRRGHTKLWALNLSTRLPGVLGGCHMFPRFGEREGTDRLAT
jgi:hypothetical protein